MLAVVGGGLVALVGLVVLAATMLGTTSEEVVRERDAEVGGRARSGTGPPGLSDHWHAAYGIDVCGEWFPDLVDLGPDALGIHTHADGIIHIHPFTARATGDGAVMGHFFDAVGLAMDGDDVTTGGASLAPADRTCDGEPAAWRLVRFEPDVHGDDPVAVVDDATDIPDVRFRADRQAFVLAFLPADELPTPPPSMSYLDRVSPPPT